MSWFGIASYGITALAYGAAAVILLFSLPRSRRATLLAAAVTLSSFWGGGATLLLMTSRAPPAIAVVGLDVLHLLVWVVWVISCLRPPASRWLLAGAVVAALVPAGIAELSWTIYPALVLVALVGFLAVEQLFRSAESEHRAHLTLLCLAVGGMFAIDLFVYSHAALLGGIEPFFWQARGFANVALLPLIVLGVKRQSEWERELFVSRQVVLYTASLVGVGGYLLAMGLVAYVIRAIGAQWSLPLEIVFLLASVGVLLAVLFSASIRGRFKVWLVKHFYRNKYDYREEWLRLTQSLGRTGDLRLVAENALEGLMRIIGSPAGELWLEREAERYDVVVASGGRAAGSSCEKSHPLPAFLAATGWVVDTEQYEREPERYGRAFGAPGEIALAPRSLIVPLDRQGYLQGFVVLAKPAGLRSLNFEDHDILKTAGKQVAAVLAQAIAQEKLAETRQFEAMSRLTAFLMHDLKNIVAQQELVVANAQRFRHRPEFFDDAVTTIKTSVERMKRVLGQLSSSVRSEPAPGRVDVSKILMEVRSQCADRLPIPELELEGSAAWINMDREQLTSVLTHLVRNAQDATPPDGRIAIGLVNGGGELVITVRDTGCGMDPQFVRERLFRPFDSTKGASGMGIGAYQVRHLVRSAGGEVEVASERGAGTTFRLRFPVADARAENTA